MDSLCPHALLYSTEFFSNELLYNTESDFMQCQAVQSFPALFVYKLDAVFKC